MRHKKNTAPRPELYEKLKSRDNAELTEDMEAMTEKDGELSTEEVNRLIATLDILDERVPVLTERYKANEDLKQFTEKNRSNFELSGEATKRHIRPPRSILVAAASVVVILGIMVGAQAAGLDVFGALAQWTDNIFHFTSTGEMGGSSAKPSPMSDEFYEDIQGALTKCGIAEQLAPTWYPEGFTSEGPEIWTDRTGHTVHSFFSGDEAQYFNLEFLKYASTSALEERIFEKDGAAMTQYSSNGKTFFIMSNLENTTATWSDGNTLVASIYGNISENDIHAIIDSIGG